MPSALIATDVHSKGMGVHLRSYASPESVQAIAWTVSKIAHNDAIACRSAFSLALLATVASLYVEGDPREVAIVPLDAVKVPLYVFNIDTPDKLIVYADGLSVYPHGAPTLDFKRVTLTSEQMERADRGLRVLMRKWGAIRGLDR